MVNQQLVEYIKSQLQLGASKDSIEGALVGAGWSREDIDDSMKSVEVPSAPSAPIYTAAPATISVSDLIPNFQLEVVSPANGDKKARDDKPNAQKLEEISAKEGKEAAASKFGKSAFFAIVFASVAIACAGGAAYLYFQNSNLQSDLATATASGEAASAKISGLNSQIADLTKERDDLKSRVSAPTSLADENAALKMELSFFVIPPGSISSAAMPATVKGMLSGGGKQLYVVTAADGLKVSVKNSRDTKVDAALKSLLGVSVEVSGTHLPGSSELTVISVNGVAVQ